MLFVSAAHCQPALAKYYQLRIHYVDKDSSFVLPPPALITSFAGRPQCMDYINKLPSLFINQGYAAASVDKIFFDSTFALIEVFLGEQQKWIQLNTDSIEKRALDEAGYLNRDYEKKPVRFSQLQQLKESILNYYEKNGYPFAAVYLDSIRLEQEGMYGMLKNTKGPLYHVDSISVKGKMRISNTFLQRYLGITNGSVYNREKLEQVDKRIAELPYAEAIYPSELQMLGTGSVLNLYLQQKKSNQVNFLIGFLPANTQTNKLQLTGDVNLNLKNALGQAETILVNWQQLQVKSPRLNIGYQHPYIFKSAFGLDFSFDLFKKDTTFLQLNTIVGIQYILSANQAGKIFFQNQQTTLLEAGVDTSLVKITKRLPPNIDLSAVNLGLDYEWTKTNYKLNPRSGNEIKIITTAGIKKISKNDDILGLTDPAFNYSSLYDTLKLRTYQARVKLTAAHYFPVGKQGTFKAIINTGIYSSGEIFRNDLFQIGGYKLLRGFDEESIFATQYLVLTAEYRYLLGRNSYLFAFSDAAKVKNKYQQVNLGNTFVSAGIGMLFETKAGLLNMSFALGKRDDVGFSLRNGAKIHFGYINYF
ncbi:MAG: BamA/TamA family outer membrane protein [Ferruginibacter sp.]